MNVRRSIDLGACLLVSLGWDWSNERYARAFPHQPLWPCTSVTWCAPCFYPGNLISLLAARSQSPPPRSGTWCASSSTLCLWSCHMQWLFLQLLHHSFPGATVMLSADKRGEGLLLCPSVHLFLFVFLSSTSPSCGVPPIHCCDQKVHSCRVQCLHRKTDCSAVDDD